MNEFFSGFFGGFGTVVGFGIGGILLVFIAYLVYRRFIGKPISFITSLPGKGLRGLIKAPGTATSKVKKLTEGVNIPSINLSKLRGKEEPVTESTENEVQVSDGSAEVVEIKSEDTGLPPKKEKKKRFSRLKIKVPGIPRLRRRKDKEE